MLLARRMVVYQQYGAAFHLVAHNSRRSHDSELVMGGFVDDHAHAHFVFMLDAIDGNEQFPLCHWQLIRADKAAFLSSFTPFKHAALKGTADAGIWLLLVSVMNL